MAKKLFIIDGHAHIYSAFYAPMRPLSSPTGEPTKATLIFTNAMLGLIERQKPDMLVATMDSKAPSFRKEIYPEYKAHRPPMPEEMPQQIKRIEEILNAMNVPVFRIDGFEADDIIGTLSRDASKNGYDVYICSKDKDMLQLLDEHVCTYDIKKDVRKTPETFKEETSLTPDQFIDVLALQGDAADNVPGVADVGPKTALTWIQKYGSLENLYEHADEIKGKRGQSLRNSKDMATLSKELVTINCDVPMEIDYDSFALQDFDKDKLAQIFTELGFTRLLTQIGAKPVEKAAATSPQNTLFDIGQPAEEPKTAKNSDKDYQLIDTPQKYEKFLAKLKKQKIFALDTETTSLNAMAADLVGLSFSWKADTGYYLPVRGPMGQKCLELSELQKTLGPILADDSIKKIGQNIKYDLLILHNAGLAVKGVYFDTMVASYCLAAERKSNSMDVMARDYLGYEPISITELIGKGKKQITFDMVDIETAAKYAAEDADITFMLYEYLDQRLEDQDQLKKLFHDLEMPLVTVLAQMEINGVSIDIKLLKDMSTKLSNQLDGLTDKIYELAGRPFNIDSPKQLGEILFDELGMESIKSGKTSRSTDASVLDQLKDKHDIVPLILEYRQFVKLKNTYLDKLGSMVNPKTNRLHASFNQTVTATGRLSSSDPNLQNIPIRTELGKKIRGAFIGAEKTSVIVSADYSQIELRLLAHLSGDESLCNAFKADEDIHRSVAAQVYNVSPDEVTSEMRSHAKGVNFGIIYGQGPFGLAKSIGVSQSQAKKFIESYFKKYGSIRDFMDATIAKVKRTGYAETMLGRRRNIDGLTSKNFNIRSQAERLTINTTIQGSASDLIKVAMINIQKRIDKEKLPIKMILQIHDELVFEMSKNDAKKHTTWIVEEMANAIKLDIPLKVDVETGPSWLGAD